LLLFLHQGKKRPSAEGEEVCRVREGEGMRKGPLLFSSDYLFSFLDERKEAKENQAITDGLSFPGT